MDTPFVFGSARCRHAVDDDLAFSDRQVAAVEQARVEEVEEQPPNARHRREEHQRRCAAHDGVDQLLRELGIVDHSAGGYRLTEHGRKLMTALEPLQDWADDWAAATVS
jgi:hypothetical protein